LVTQTDNQPEIVLKKPKDLCGDGDAYDYERLSFLSIDSS